MEIKNVRIADRFDDYGVYDMRDILNNLVSYIGISLEDLMVKFCSADNIISVDQVRDYCENNFELLVKVGNGGNSYQDIIDSRISDYQFFVDSYNIYKNKGLDLISLMQYIVVCGNEGFVDRDRELCLKEMGIFHKNSVVCGIAVIGMLVALDNINREFDRVIYEVNNFSNYHSQRFDWFFQMSKDNVLPSESLIYDEEKMDNTSVKLIKKRWF